MTSTTSSGELLAQLIASPDDREVALVYADTLIEAGDPHGELIMLQASGVESQRERELRRQLEREIVGEEYDEEVHDDDGLVLEWRWGFVRRAVVDFDARGLTHPAMRLLDDLVIDVDEESREMLLTLELPLLRSLKLDIMTELRDDSLSRLCRAHPALERLVIIAYDDLPELDALGGLARLRSLEVEAYGMNEEELAGLLSLKLPSLQRLSLSCSDLGMADLAPLLEGRVHTSVTELGLFDTAELDVLLETLVTSPVMSRLTAIGLDTDEIEWNDDVERLFRQHRDVFGELAYFDAPDALGEDEYTLRGRGRLLSRCFDRHQEALPMLERAAELDEHDGDTFLELANTLAALGRRQDAAAAIARADALEVSNEDELAEIRARVTDPNPVQRVLAGVRRFFRR